MELEDYLIKTKEKRKGIALNAKKFVLKSQNGLPTDFNDVNYSPNPQGLKKFEQEVNGELKKYFSPIDSSEIHKKRVSPNNETIEERIRKTYTRNLPFKKKRQSIIIPRGYYASPYKFEEYFTHNKIVLSPIPSAEKNTSTKKLTPMKKSPSTKKLTLVKKHEIKDKLFKPVLSTFSHYNERYRNFKSN